jgi:hypothetical protein
LFQKHRRGLRSCLFVASVAGLFALLAGCSATRPDPAQSFDEITRRSLNEDTPYVRANLAPAYLAAAKAPQADAELNEFVHKLMAQLQLCRSVSVQKTEDPDKVTIEAACVQGGSIQQSKFDLVYDQKTGWMLAAPARDTQPLQKKNP